jgi:hypothetical protein
MGSEYKESVVSESADIEQAIEEIDTYGYCLLPDLLPADWCNEFAQGCLQLHADDNCRADIVGDEYYQTLFGMMNRDDRTWRCASHPAAVAVARHFLGDDCRVVEACSKPTWPGAPHQPLHVDSAGHFRQVPDTPWMINSIWMLSDFTVDNGATGVVPMSHRSRLRHPPAGLDPDGPLVQPVIGVAGSLLMWHGGTIHMARAHRGSAVRLGLNVAYYPIWFNNWIENGHQPVWPETYERMPEQMQQLCTGKRARHRDDAYESDPVAEIGA